MDNYLTECFISWLPLVLVDDINLTPFDPPIGSPVPLNISRFLFLASYEINQIINATAHSAQLKSNLGQSLNSLYSL